MARGLLDVLREFSDNENDFISVMETVARMSEDGGRLIYMYLFAITLLFCFSFRSTIFYTNLPIKFRHLDKFVCVCLEPTVRAELMEQVPNIAMFLHESRPNFPAAFSRYLVPIVVRYLTDPNNQVGFKYSLCLQ